MNRILFEIQESSYILDPRDPRFEHVRGVLRMREGDIFDVGVINGPVGKATILGLTKQSMEVAVDWADRPPLPPPVHLMVGMCRPATARKILTTAPTLGVRKICFATTGRSDPAYAKSGLWKSGEARQRLIEGAGQAFDTYVPELNLYDDLCAAVEAVDEGCTERLALDVYEGSRPLSSVVPDPARPVCLAIGPERGWNANDRRILQEKGFELVSLNERVLRVETAVTVGLTLVLSRMGAY